MSLLTPSSNRYNPPTFEDMFTKRGAQQTFHELDNAMRIIFQLIYGMDNTVCVQAGGKSNITTLDERNPLTVKVGTATVTGSKAITTGLTTVSGVWLSTKVGTAQADYQLTWTVSGGTVTVFVWRPTNAATTTPIAEASPLTISWLVMGS